MTESLLFCLPDELLGQVCRFVSRSPVLLGNDGTWIDPLYALRLSCKELYARIPRHPTEEAVYYVAQLAWNKPMPLPRTKVREARLLFVSHRLARQWVDDLVPSVLPDVICWVPDVWQTRHLQPVQAKQRSEIRNGMIPIEFPVSVEDDTEMMIWQLETTLRWVKRGAEIDRCRAAWATDLEEICARQDEEAREFIRGILGKIDNETKLRYAQAEIAVLEGRRSRDSDHFHLRGDPILQGLEIDLIESLRRRHRPHACSHDGDA